MIIVKDGKCNISGDKESLLVELAAIFKGLEMMDEDVLWQYAPIKSNIIGVYNDTYITGNRSRKQNNKGS